MKPYILDKVIEEKKREAEYTRKKLICRVFKALECASVRFGFKKAYIFGSISKKDRYTEYSDIDIAIENIYPPVFFKLKAFLENMICVEIDLADLGNIHFKDKVIKEGIAWKKKDMPLLKQK